MAVEAATEEAVVAAAVALVAAVKMEEEAEAVEAQAHAKAQAGVEQTTEEQRQRIAAAAQCDCEVAGERLPSAVQTVHDTNNPNPRRLLLSRRRSIGRAGGAGFDDEGTLALVRQATAHTLYNWWQL